jgi:hypothetical protein
MIQKDLLWGRWNIWFSYYLTEEQKKESDYNDTLRKVHSIEKLADIVYLLSNSPLSDLTRFFVTTAPEGSNNICPTYISPHADTKLMASPAKSMQSTISAMELSPLGRTRATPRAGA